MPSNCSVFGCHNTRTQTAGSDIRYFRFPRAKELRQRWIHSCCRTDSINAVVIEEESLRYIGGYIARKFCVKYPPLGQKAVERVTKDKR